MSIISPVYTKSAQYFHWLVAAPLIGSIGCVLKAQESPKEEKGLWMHRHKSLGLLTAMVVAPRAAYRLWTFSRNSLPKLSGSSNMEHLAGTAGHIGLYGFMTVMPATGIAMGYYGGKGLPFFGTTFAGAVRTEENKAAHGGIAKQSFKIHKTLGTYGKYLIPVHVSAAFMHAYRGQSIFKRISIFRGPSY